jgi:hypothetical protein
MNASLLLGDSIRWLMATVLMLLVTVYSFMAAFYVFEFILTHVIQSGTIIYLLLWSFILPTAVVLVVFVTSFLCKWLMRLVRQKKWFGNIFGTIYLVAIPGILLTFWFGVWSFSWQEASQHHTLNAWMFSLFMLGMVGIPMKIAENYAAFAKQTVE